MAPVEHVVADAGAFLRGAPLQEIGRNIYTIREVVAEIRDKETRRRLAVLPYELRFKQPFPEYVRLVTEFSKKTGDYPSLSATDIQVLALTYQLEAEIVGAGHLKKEPEQVTVSSTKQHPEAPVHVAGFHLPSKAKCAGGKRSPGAVRGGEGADSGGPENAAFGSFLYWRNPLPSIEEDLQELLASAPPTPAPAPPLPRSSACPSPCLQALGQPVPQRADAACVQSQESDTEEGPGGGGGSDEEGWITPSNLQQTQQQMGLGAEEPAGVQVGCVTTDFAMQASVGCSGAVRVALRGRLTPSRLHEHTQCLLEQECRNVLLQLGLHVLAVNGLLIRHTRSHVLRCHGCFKTTSEMTRLFCPHCGNKTLKKVAVSVGDDGSLHMHFSHNPKVLNPRGLRHSLPAPQGGKHPNNPHLTEDQRFPQQRLSRKARQKTDVFDPDYTAGASPFVDNDIYSRAANLQIRDAALGAGRRRLNPNTAKKKFVRKR
ncbi:hypothetical protein lerEdw1_011484 [Lerista edwardsae]|nr:hypothetical protein lerEdw1_011484 [Lerista edwardsae]